MEKLDRLGWAGGVCFRSFGMRLGIRTNTPEVPEDLFAYLPQATQHLARFTQEVMRGPSPLSPGMRELIAAFTSSRNQCPF